MSIATKLTLNLVVFMAVGLWMIVTAAGPTYHPEYDLRIVVP